MNTVHSSTRKFYYAKKGNIESALLLLSISRSARRAHIRARPSRLKTGAVLGPGCIARSTGSSKAIAIAEESSRINIWNIRNINRSFLGS